MKKWLLPIASGIITFILIVIIALIALQLNGDGTGYGGVAVVMIGLVKVGLLIIPCICFCYSHFCLLNQKNKLLFAVYHSFFVTLGCLLGFLGNIYNLFFLFVWSVLWSLLGLIKIRRKNRNSTD